jgi:hypothetical protein
MEDEEVREMKRRWGEKVRERESEIERKMI